jgi:hypothetical protein
MFLVIAQTLAIQPAYINTSVVLPVLIREVTQPDNNRDASCKFERRTPEHQPTGQ